MRSWVVLGLCLTVTLCLVMETEATLGHHLLLGKLGGLFRKPAIKPIIKRQYVPVVRPRLPTSRRIIVKTIPGGSKTLRTAGAAAGAGVGAGLGVGVGVGVGAGGGAGGAGGGGGAGLGAGGAGFGAGGAGLGGAGGASAGVSRQEFAALQATVARVEGTLQASLAGLEGSLQARLDGVDRALQAELDAVERDLQSQLDDAEGTLTTRLARVESRGCFSGQVDADICDEDDSSYLCDYRTYYYGQQQTVNIPIEFEDDFDDVPVVTAGLSGFFSQYGKNCSVEVIDVTKKGCTLRVSLDGAMPLNLKLFWFACDERSDDDDDR